MDHRWWGAAEYYLHPVTRVRHWVQVVIDSHIDSNLELRCLHVINQRVLGFLQKLLDLTTCKQGQKVCCCLLCSRVSGGGLSQNVTWLKTEAPSTWQCFRVKTVVVFLTVLAVSLHGKGVLGSQNYFLKTGSRVKKSKNTLAFWHLCHVDRQNVNAVKIMMSSRCTWMVRELITKSFWTFKHNFVFKRVDERSMHV